MRDLVLSTPWSSEVAVLFGPIAAGMAASMSDAPLVIRNPTEGGLSNRFGLGVHVADVTGDGAADLVIGASAEGEEACFGTDDTVIFAGPLGPGQLTEEDATLRIEAATTGCLGFPIASDLDLGDPQRASLLVGGSAEAVWFDLPLLDPPSVVGRATGRYLATAGDLDGDGRTDLFFESSIQYGDGRAVEFLFNEQITTQVNNSVSWMTEGQDVILSTSTAERVTYRRIIDGEADPLAFPSIAFAESGSAGHPASTGDVDGDGLADLVIGDQLIRCVEP